MTWYDSVNEVGLIERLAQGDEHAFTEIYNLYWKRLIALAYTHVRDKFLAEEIVQEVFLSLWNRKETLEINSLNAYLATSVKFSIFTQVARRNRKEEIIDGISKNAGFAHASYLPDELFHAKFLEDYVNRIVDELPEKCRMVYIASRKHEMTIPEIAAKMNIADKTVEAHLTKALKTLRLNLKDVLLIILLFKFF